MISLELTSISARVPIGSAPTIAVEAKNLGSDNIWLVGVLDGSESGARYPRWSPTVEGPVGRLLPPELPDFTTPLLPVDFRRLEPGEGFDPTIGVSYFPLSLFSRIGEAAGRYRVSLELDTESPTEQVWFGTLPDRRPQAAVDAAEAQRLLSRVPRLRVRSNILLIEVTGG